MRVQANKTNKQAQSKQANKRANKQATKANKQTNKQASKKERRANAKSRTSVEDHCEGLETNKTYKQTQNKQTK